MGGTAPVGGSAGCGGRAPEVQRESATRSASVLCIKQQKVRVAQRHCVPGTLVSTRKDQNSHPSVPAQSAQQLAASDVVRGPLPSAKSVLLNIAAGRKALSLQAAAGFGGGSGGGGGGSGTVPIAKSTLPTPGGAAAEARSSVATPRPKTLIRSAASARAAGSAAAGVKNMVEELESVVTPPDGASAATCGIGTSDSGGAGASARSCAAAEAATTIKSRNSGVILTKRRGWAL